MPTTREVAEDLVALGRDGKIDDAGHKYWADDVVSLEAMDGPMARVEGKAAVIAKGEWWYANNEVHEIGVEGPYVNGDQFAVRFRMDVTPKDGERTQMDEIGLYTVKDGKIVEERFLY
jgi:hypothetical protein